MIGHDGAAIVGDDEAGVGEVAVHGSRPEIDRLLGLEGKTQCPGGGVGFLLTSEARADEGGDDHCVAGRGAIGRGGKPTLMRLSSGGAETHGRK